MYGVNIKKNVRLLCDCDYEDKEETKCSVHQMLTAVLVDAMVVRFDDLYVWPT